VSDSARRVYLAMGRGFLGLGGLIAALSIADAAFDLGYFRGSPLGTAIFLALVGAALLWTVRQADAQRADDRGDGADAAAEEREDRSA
jgi:hypothetical protein